MSTVRALALCVSIAALGCKADGTPAPDAPQPELASSPVAQAAPTVADGAPEPTVASDKTLAATQTNVDETEPEGEPEAAPEVAVASPAEGGDEAPDQPAHEGPYRILILGDSLAATGFGALLERKLDGRDDILCYRKGKSATGLARPDFFDWMDQAKRQIEFRKPELVIVIMGGNDGQDLTTRSGKGKRVHWGDDDWAEVYRKRMDAFLTEIGGTDRKIVWLGLPTMGLRSLEKKLVMIRQVQREAVEAFGANATYVDTAPFVSDESGAMLKQAKVEGHRKLQDLRADDRIHFTMSGSQYLADHVYPEVLAALGLSDEVADPGPDM